MYSSLSLLLFLSFLFFFSSSSAAAFNITKILNAYSDQFGAFNSLLSQTDLATPINDRQTITVLAVGDGAVGALSGKPDYIVKRILSVHVVLDYYDMEKMKKLSGKKKKWTILTTMFQSTGLARHQQGFINITVPSPDVEGGEIRLGSASPGAVLNANLVQQVFARPYNICVLHISSMIIPPGIEDIVQPVHPPKKAPSPKSAKGGPSQAPDVEAPAPLDGFDAPASSPPEPKPDHPADAPVTDGPIAYGPAADSPRPRRASPSLATRTTLGRFLGAAMGLVCMVAV